MRRPVVRRLDPLDYPWTAAAQSGQLLAGEWLPGSSPEPEPGQTWVLGIGSNAAPMVLGAKLIRSSRNQVPIRTGHIANVAIGHAARVSVGGYLAWAAWRRAGTSTQVVAAALDASALAELDRTEPNYRRIRLDLTEHPVQLDGDPKATGFELYDTRWGVLAHGREVIPAGRQSDLLELLRRAPELADVLPLGSPGEIADCLRDNAIRDRVNAALGALGLASGLVGDGRLGIRSSDVRAAG